MNRYIVSVVFRDIKAKTAPEAARYIREYIETNQMEGLGNCLFYAIGKDNGEAYTSGGKRLERKRIRYRAGDPLPFDTIG